MHQSGLERAVSQAQGKGLDTSAILSFPIAEIMDQQNNRVRQYQTLEFKVIKKLKTAMAQHGPMSLFYTIFVVYCDGVKFNSPRLEDYVSLLCQEEIFFYFGILNGVKLIRELSQ